MNGDSSIFIIKAIASQDFKLASGLRYSGHSAKSVRIPALKKSKMGFSQIRSLNLRSVISGKSDINE
jgi:hypothetical protein